MDIIFFAIILGTLLLIVANAPQPGRTTIEPCKYHDWHQTEVVDKDGELQGYKLICRKCGSTATP